MAKIDWNIFKFKNENFTKSFEDLCYHLFCRKFKMKEGIRTDYNQIGLETYPIKYKNKNLVGFQSKFFENKLSQRSSINQIISSIKKAKSSYKGLNRIIIYTHQSFGSKRPKYKVEIENAAKPIKIEWCMESNFKSILSQPSNIDLAQNYFGLSDEIGFIKNSINKDILTFLQSSLYIDLPMKDNSNNIADIKSEIQKTPNFIILITGNPGSGKSILMHKLLEYFGALEQTSKRKMINQLTLQGAVPTLINLKNCVSDSLENILRGRQNDCKIRSNNLKFIYLFDGLDELSEQNAENVLSYIAELKQNNNTHKIIISCRTGNTNKLKAFAYFNDIKEYYIADLNKKHIDKYFNAKLKPAKLLKLAELKLTNKNLLQDIKDILLIDLFWDTIEQLNSKSTITDLLEKKINMLIDDPKHKKNIEELNLLNPKKEEILYINQELSFEFQKIYQYRFPLSRIQEIVLKKFPKLDYKSVNIIINYISDLFFDTDFSNVEKDQTFVYQHRRYQDFFFIQKLKILYEENPKILRELQIFSNYDLFENLFLKYLRWRYEQ